MDKIFVENLMVIGKHGVMKHEQSFQQKFLVDIAAYFDVSKCTQTDKLDDTLNYVYFCDVARQTIEGESVYLIEKLTSLIADKILEDKRIKKVEVSIRKPSALPSGVPGVTIIRTRAN